MSSAKTFFSVEEQKLIVEAIQAAEKNTSGEIRLHVEETCNQDVLDRAAQIFALLKMHKTKLRNGVLFYLAVKSRKFAIIGDVGINAKVEGDFWEKEKAILLQRFKQGQHADGLIEAIALAGERLKIHFPYQDDDINELPDDISFGEDNK